MQCTTYNPNPARKMAVAKDNKLIFIKCNELIEDFTMINDTEGEGNRRTKKNLKKRSKNCKHFNGSLSWESKERVHPES